MPGVDIGITCGNVQAERYHSQAEKRTVHTGVTGLLPVGLSHPGGERRRGTSPPRTAERVKVAVSAGFSFPALEPLAKVVNHLLMLNAPSTMTSVHLDRIGREQLSPNQPVTCR